MNPPSPHILRMAATRAKARALRDFTGVDMVALEELGGDVAGADADELPVATPERSLALSLDRHKARAARAEKDNQEDRRYCAPSAGRRSPAPCATSQRASSESRSAWPASARRPRSSSHRDLASKDAPVPPRPVQTHPSRPSRPSTSSQMTPTPYQDQWWPA